KACRGENRTTRELRSQLPGSPLRAVLALIGVKPTGWSYLPLAATALCTAAVRISATVVTSLSGSALWMYFSTSPSTCAHSSAAVENFASRTTLTNRLKPYSLLKAFLLSIKPLEASSSEAPGCSTHSCASVTACENRPRGT